MPEPISSSNGSPPPHSGFAADPTLDEAGQICRGEVNGSSPPPLPPSEPPPRPLGVAKLLSVAPPPPSLLPPASTLPPAAQNNAQRTSEMGEIVTGYFDAGVTGGAQDGLYVAAAAIKGRDAKSGLELEVLSASAQIGGENEAQAALARVGISGKNGSLASEVFTVRAAGGAHNDDGSVGINSGIIATVVGAEGTWLHGSDSLTLGASFGVGLAGSAGLRDLDDNGVPEICVKASVGFFTAGICWEQSP